MIIRHVHKPSAINISNTVRQQFHARGITTVDEDYEGNVDLIVAAGGDGTLLAAADTARNRNIPLIGINLGHMGFLTEVESEGIEDLVEHISTGSFHIDKRMTLDVAIKHNDGRIDYDWALNEAAVVTTDIRHPAHLGVGVDERGLSTYGADGIIVATPTGSTAYAFSAGGPIVWPDVEAVVVCPLAAHGLFTRPIVISPNSTLEVAVRETQQGHLTLACDGIRTHELDPGSFIKVTRGKQAIQLVRISRTPFIERLVYKFDLPVRGWKAMTDD